LQAIAEYGWLDIIADFARLRGVSEEDIEEAFEEDDIFMLPIF
jgi:hypothetical protein